MSFAAIGGAVVGGVIAGEYAKTTQKSSEAAQQQALTEQQKFQQKQLEQQKELAEQQLLGVQAGQEEALQRAIEAGQTAEQQFMTATEGRPEAISRLQQILREELELANMTLPNGEIDHEGRMAKRQLEDIAEYSRELCQMLQDDTQLESWVQAKITKAADYISKVKHYLEYEMKNGKHDQITAEMPKMDPMAGKIGEFPLESDETYEF